MFWKKIGLAGLILCILTMVSPEVTLADFSDGFQDGDINGWSVYSGKWAAVNDGTGNKVLKSEDIYAGIYIDQLQGFEDFELSVDVRFPEGPLFESILVRGQTGLQSGYAVRLYAEWIDVPYRQFLPKIYFYKGEGDPVAAGKLDRYVSFDAWLRVRVIAKGNVFEVYVDDGIVEEKLFTYVDTDNTYRTGRLGLLTSSRPSVQFDNMRIITNTVPTDLNKDSWVDVRAFGAVGDGVADDTKAIKDAISFMAAVKYNRNILFFPPGVYLVTSTLAIPANCKVIGSGMWDAPNLPKGTTILGRHNGAAVISLAAQNYVQLENLIIKGDNIITPKTGLLLGRRSQAVAGYHTIQQVVVKGYYSHAAIYSIASEENHFTDIYGYVEGGTAKHVFYTSQSDDLNVDGLIGSSNFRCSLNNFRFHHCVNATETSGLTMSVGKCTGLWAFRDGYMISANGSYVTIIVGQVDAQPCSGPITFDNIGGEVWGGPGPDKGFYIIGNMPLLNFAVRGGGLAGRSYAIYADNVVELINADISSCFPLIFGSTPSRFYSLKYSNINLAGDVTVTGNAVKNIIRDYGILTIQGTNDGNLIIVP